MPTYFLYSVISIVMISASSFTSAASPETIETYLKKPLILGASVSAGKHAVSPSRKLALKYTGSAKIKTVAQSGKSGREVLKSVPHDMIIDRSMIIGLDLFFWDSSFVNVTESTERLHGIVREAQGLNIPILIGDIPPLRSSRQPSYLFLNIEIQKACASYSQCIFMPLTKYYQRLANDGFLIIHGKKYLAAELMPDGLHLSEVGTQYLADEMENLLKDLAKKPVK